MTKKQVMEKREKKTLENQEGKKEVQVTMNKKNNKRSE